MTNQPEQTVPVVAVRQRLDQLGEWAAASLRLSRQSPHNHLAELFRGNARCYNEAAGLLALDLGLAEFTDYLFRPPTEQLSASRALAHSDPVEDFLSGFALTPCAA